MDGVIVVDKEEGWTSHDVVGKMRGIAKTKRIGHLGTLDPTEEPECRPLVISQGYARLAVNSIPAAIRFTKPSDSASPPTLTTAAAYADRR